MLCARAAPPQCTLETLKVPDRDAERELVDAVNDATPECVARGGGGADPRPPALTTRPPRSQAAA